MRVAQSRGLLVLTLAFGTVACTHAQKKAAPAQQQEPELIQLTIVGTSDVHGWIEPHDSPNGSEPIIGGADILGGYLDNLRARRPDGVVLLDAGDFLQGTLVANVTEGAAIVRAYNALGYDAVAIGDREFYFGPEGDPVVALTPTEDPVGSLKKRIGEAHFPFLTGNIVTASTGDPVSWPNAPQTKMIRRRGIKIGIIGMTTPSTPTVTQAQNVSGLTFRPLVDTAIQLASDLRKDGAQVILLAVHAGGGCPLENDQDDLTNCDPGELFPLLNALPEGTVDAVVAGHSQSYLAQFVHNIPAIQSKSDGEAFGVIELTFNRSENKVDTSRTQIWEPTPLCRRVYSETGKCTKGSGPLEQPQFLGQPVVPDSDVKLAVASDIEAVRKEKSEQLGPTLRVPLTRARLAESAMGDLVTDVMRETVAGAQVALMNSGGIRADIGLGPVTYGAVFDALPFENHLAVMQLTGEELMEMLTRGVSGDHGLLQVSGVKLQAVDAKAKPCGPTRLISATLADGSPILPDQSYSVVTNEYIAGGGDGFDAVLKKVDSTRINVRVDMPPVRDLVVSWFRLHPDLTGPAEKPEERIHIVVPYCSTSKAR